MDLVIRSTAFRATNLMIDARAGGRVRDGCARVGAALELAMIAS
jgi:hypothetical protein